MLELVAPANLARAIGEMESDDAADVVDDLEDDKRGEVLAAMSAADRDRRSRAALSYADETAGRLMQREVLAAPQFWTVGQAIEHIRPAATTCRNCSSTSMWSTRRTSRSGPRP